MDSKNKIKCVFEKQVVLFFFISVGKATSQREKCLAML